MSKSKNIPDNVGAKTNEGPRKRKARADVFAALNTAAAAMRRVHGLKAIGAIMFIAISLYWSSSIDASSAILYLFAFNGKVSGRMDGNVLMRNGRGRGFTVPALVRNAYTVLQRALLSSLSSGWAALTDGERDSWLNVTNVFKSDRFGQQKAVKGKSLFVERNQNLINVGEPTITSYIPSDGVGAITAADPNIAVTTGVITTLTIDVEPDPTPAGQTTLVFATAQLGAGINRPGQSAFRLIGAQAGGSASPLNVLAVYTAKYGAVAQSGTKIFFQLKPVNIETGQAGIPIQTVVTVP